MACATVGEPPRATRVLFVGNSITYTNNLPAVFKAVALASGTTYATDQFAKGGASLTDWNANAQVRDRIASGDYGIVVLQERGGFNLCVVDDHASADCEVLIRSHVELAELARQHGASVVYLGTYQLLSPQASEALVRAETILASRMGARYVEVSEHFRRLRRAHPELSWLSADGVHPGMATTALMASGIYEALVGAPPTASDLCIAEGMARADVKHDGIATDGEFTTQGEQRCVLTREQMRLLAH